ncbi:hypothetical protein [Solimonas terrae]|uniref:Uncharacterized protein n=1 Tax=Solimonas terrae TaxID=1396819 RepID=A0A6M2BWP9_9GAMM|nr:hypothetical protein [Solimonas terrae]NGY07026.1 hypothetical protein [Solimonas terrae]
MNTVVSTKIEPTVASDATCGAEMAIPRLPNRGGLRVLLAVVCLVTGFAAGPLHAASGNVWIAELVWAPQYCRDNADERSSEACNQAYGLVLRRLRPPGDRKCGGTLSDATIDSAVRFIVSRRWVQQMWRRDGGCSGKTDREYFDFISLMMDRIEVPQSLREAPRQPARTSGPQLERDLLDVNRGLRPDATVLHCGGTFLTQLDLCFDDDLNAATCPADRKRVCADRIDLRSAN